MEIMKKLIQKIDDNMPKINRFFKKLGEIDDISKNINKNITDTTKLLKYELSQISKSSRKNIDFFTITEREKIHYRQREYLYKQLYFLTGRGITTLRETYYKKNDMDKFQLSSYIETQSREISPKHMLLLLSNEKFLSLLLKELKEKKSRKYKIIETILDLAPKIKKMIEIHENNITMINTNIEPNFPHTTQILYDNTTILNSKLLSLIYNKDDLHPMRISMNDRKIFLSRYDRYEYRTRFSTSDTEYPLLILDYYDQIMETLENKKQELYEINKQTTEIKEHIFNAFRSNILTLKLSGKDPLNEEHIKYIRMDRYMEIPDKKEEGFLTYIYRTPEAIRKHISRFQVDKMSNPATILISYMFLRNEIKFHELNLWDLPTN